MTTAQSGLPVADCLTTDGQLDIERAIDSAEVDYDETTYDHDGPEHCEAAADGRVVVGVTNDAGEVVLTVDQERGYAFVPNAVVEPDEQFADVARQTAETLLETTVAVESVHRVRQLTHRVDGTPQEQTTHVVVSATPTERAGDPTTPADGMTAGWHSELPDGIDAVGDVATDIGVFLPE